MGRGGQAVQSLPHSRLHVSRRRCRPSGLAYKAVGAKLALILGSVPRRYVGDPLHDPAAVHVLADGQPHDLARHLQGPRQRELRGLARATFNAASSVGLAAVYSKFRVLTVYALVMMGTPHVRPSVGQSAARQFVPRSRGAALQQLGVAFPRAPSPLARSEWRSLRWSIGTRAC